MATMPRFTIMREDVSYVLAREYGDPRDSTTILAALLAIGGAKRVLILSDDDDGVWTLSNDITIPPNVTLSLPSGVTLTGTGNLIIEGNLLALRTDWWQSTGVVTWGASLTPWETSRAHIGHLNLDMPLTITSGGTGASTVPQAQINLGIVPGTDIQPYDPTLTAFAAAATGPNLLWYFTGVDNGTTTAFTALARTLVGGTTQAAMQATLGLQDLAILDAVDTAQILDRAVTYTKIQHVTNARLLGRADSVAGPTQEISVGAGLTLVGGVLGLQGGSVSGAGATNRAVYWTGPTSQGYDEGYQYDPTPHLLTVPRFRGSDLTNHAFILGTDASEAPGFSHAFLRFNDIVANTPQWLTGLRVVQSATRGAISLTTVLGLAVHTNMDQASFNFSGDPLGFDFVGIESLARATGSSGTVSRLGGMLVRVENTGTGTVSITHGISIQSINAGTMGHFYGVVVQNTPTTVGGNSAAYYSDTSAGTNRFNLLLIGTAPSYILGGVGVGGYLPADISQGIYSPNTIRGGALHSLGDVNVNNHVNVIKNVIGQGFGAFVQGVAAGTGGTPQGGRKFDCWGHAYISQDLYVGGAMSATNATQTRANLGLGSMATQNAGAVAITGGTAGLDELSVGYLVLSWYGSPTQAIYVNDGPAGSRIGLYSGVSAGVGRYNLYIDGTAINYINGQIVFGDAGNTRANLGLGTMSVQNASAVTITGGAATFTSGVVTSNLGFYRPNGAGDNAYALYSDLAVAGGNTRYGLRLVGDAPNYMMGRLGIGGTPDASANGQTLIVFNKVTDRGLVIRASGTDTGGVSVGFQAISGSFPGYILTDATTTQYATASDGRLKHAIAPLTGALDVIRALQPRRFRWRENDNPGVGFIAQEVAAIVDGVITGEPDAVDNEGRIVSQMIDHSKLVPWLTSALQDALAQIDALATRVHALEGRA